jgi:hypothetical protein
VDAHISVFANRLTPETINRISQERAIAAFADALSVWSRETHAEQWAAARMNLGTLYWQRVAGHRSDNRERAIAAFEDALFGLDPRNEPGRVGGRYDVSRHRLPGVCR